MGVDAFDLAPVAVILFNEKFRRYVAEKQKYQHDNRGWDVGVIISGGNTTVEALSKLFGEKWLHDDDTSDAKARTTAEVSCDGMRRVEDVAG